MDEGPVGMPEIEKRFTHHPPKGDQTQRYHAIRVKARYFADLIMLNCPASRERSIAIAKLEEAVMWANAAIARRE